MLANLTNVGSVLVTKAVLVATHGEERGLQKAASCGFSSRCDAVRRALKHRYCFLDAAADIRQSYFRYGLTDQQVADALKAAVESVAEGATVTYTKDDIFVPEIVETSNSRVDDTDYDEDEDEDEDA